MSWPPLVSVVIPVRNDGPNLAVCLESVRRNTYPREQMEILVVDGESRDNTAEVVRQYAAAGLPARLVTNPWHSRCAALNLGVVSAQGEVVMRLDARSRIPPDYIARCVETLMRTGASNVGGVTKPAAESPAEEAIGLGMSHPFGVGNAQFRLGRKAGFVDTVYPGCFRRDVFERVGLFDEAAPVISEDSDLNQRIRESGGKIYLDPTIEIYYRPRSNWRDLWKLYFRYGGARLGNILKHGGPSALRQLVPPTFVATLVGLAALSFVHGVFLFGFLGLLGLYGACTVGVAASLAFRERKWRLFPRLALTFPCMHFAYGLAFLGRLLWQPRSDRFLET